MNTQLFERTKVDLDTTPEVISVAENNEPLVALVPGERLGIRPIWELHPYSIEGRMYRRYIAERPEYRDIYVRRRVAEMLQDAAKSLPPSWQLTVVAGHRPMPVQQSLYDYEYARLRTRHSELNDDEIATMTRLYVADPSRKSPAHCCGSAVDVKVVDIVTGEDIDFGSSVNSATAKSHIHSSRISEAARANRLVLLEAMLGAGFSSLHSEWWHFSYGDQNWAAFYQISQAIYGAKAHVALA